MTTTEFSNEFDILYNSIATNAAPDIDIYEKSVYLTKAQEELVKNYFNPKGNKYQDGFENSSKRRNDLSQLIKGYNSNYSSTIDNNFKEFAISNDSKFFKIPKEVFLIIQESCVIHSKKISSGFNNIDNIDTKIVINKNCIDNLVVSVVPKTHDEFNFIKNNPFRKPSKTVTFRLDFNSNNLEYKIVELISPFNIRTYKLRYVKYPKPIILKDLTVEFPGEGLSINSETLETQCELNSEIHREILDRAVELALVDYRPELLNVKTQINNRNE